VYFKQGVAMGRKRIIPLVLTALLATGAVVHHGWANYDSDRTLNVAGTLQNVRYANPHVLIDLQTAWPSSQTWEVVLAPPARMRARGLPDDALSSGVSARVVGHPHRRTEGEMRALRIIIGNDTTELR
jgi:hypothetical protein